MVLDFRFLDLNLEFGLKEFELQNGVESMGLGRNRGKILSKDAEWFLVSIFPLKRLSKLI